MRSVFPIGTTIYEPDKCYNGYTLLWYNIYFRLMDMNARVVHEWPAKPKDVGLEGSKGSERAKLLPNGNLLILFAGTKDKRSVLAEYTWDGELVWQHTPLEGRPHHDFFPKENGNVLMICSEPVPEEIKKKITQPERQGVNTKGDVYIEVDREGKTVWEWHCHDHMDINKCTPVPADRGWWAGPDNNTVSDWIHTNTIQALPKNRLFDAGDKRFKPGNVLVSMRQQDTIMVIDRDSGEITWSYTGDYKGGLSGQHESVMIEKGVPGEGNILVFDNGACPVHDLAHAGCSFALEIDPGTDKVVWVYEDGEKFHSNFTSSTQRLANGNTLICECTGCRVFEVTPNGKIVWEYVGDGDNRSYRYPYDYCPQAAALPEPKEQPVRPPREFRIEPENG